MTKIEEIKTILSEHKNELREKYRVKQIGIFGSYIRNEQRQDSDTDILVEFSEPVSLFEFMNLENYLTSLVKNKVDLVSKKALKPFIGKQILNEVIYI